MLNVLLLGNGFDLNLRLPTGYINFLHTVEFIRRQKFTNYKTVGDIWGKPYFAEQDPMIKESYERYKEIYDTVELPINFVRDIGLCAEKNHWFRYLVEVCNKDIGWIDFEKEISDVIKSFQSVFDRSNGDSIVNETGGFFPDFFTVFSFDFFSIGGNNVRHSIMKGSYPVRGEYLVEYPQGSGKKIIDKQKIIDDLYKSLQELAKLLQSYLRVFVDSTVEKLVEQNKIECITSFTNADYVITLNYTHSFERMHASIPVIHLHGETTSDIVLGVSADENDEIDVARTDFVAFKKYYQRVVYNTDVQYLAYINKLKKDNEKISLMVMGHSLDVSDRDVINELFSMSAEITIAYHKQNVIGGYVSNLVKIFGKTGLDMLRSEKGLSFITLEELRHPSSDYSMNQFWNSFEVV